MSDEVNRRFTTPYATSMWSRLQTVDRKYAKPGEPGDYRIDLHLGSEQGLEVLKHVTQLRDALKQEEGAKVRKAKNAPLPIQEVLDEEGTPTGEYRLRCRQSEWIEFDGQRKRMSVRVLDAKLKPTQAEPGNGSKVRVAGTFRAWVSKEGFGVTFHPEFCQIVTLLDGGRSLETTGLEAVEDDGAFVDADFEGPSKEASGAFEDETEESEAGGAEDL